MLFAEISSIFYPIMADAFANLAKADRIEKAVNACRQDSRLTARKAAKIFNIHHSTIGQRLKELVEPRKLINQAQQLLTPVEERTIVKFVIQYYKWGLPLGLKQIRQFATEILLRKRPQPQGSMPSIGKNWHSRLIARNPQIKRVIARGLDRTRASVMLKVEIFTQFFELLSSLRQQYNIQPQDIYNMDEKGFYIGAIQRSHVLILVAEREAFLRQDGNREWVSIIESISDIVEALPSSIIFKAVYQQSS